MSMAGRLLFDDGVREEDSGGIVGGSNDDSLCRFERLFPEFFSEICVFNCVLPYPPMLSDGQDVDLYRLFLVVRGKGGYDAVCNGKLWDSVGEESGMGVSVGSSVELVYSRYLSALDSWMKKVAESKVSPECGVVDNRDKFGRRLMELQAEVEGLFSGCAEDRVVVAGEDVEGGLDEDDHILDRRELCGANGVKGSGDEGGEHGECSDSETPDHDMNEAILGNSDKGNGAMGREEGFDRGKMTEEQAVDISDGANNSGAELLSGGKKCEDYDDKGVVLDASGGNSGDGDSSGHKRKREGSVLDSSSDDSDSPSRKRMRESAMDMLSWVTGVAKNPSEPEVGSIPERSKWKSYSNQEVWKQVLLFREAAFYRRGSEPSNEQRSWQNQKMHPCLYEDQVGTNYNLRDRLKCDKKLLFGKSTSSGRSSSDSSVGTENRTPSPRTEDQSEKRLHDSSDANLGLDKCATVRIPLGANHQAEIPEWTGVTSESDSKWLGTRVWPQERVNTRLIERDPIGKGRQDSCGCSEQGSVECVRFHISEKRAKVQLELGAAFYDWNFDQVGEGVRLMWTKEEEKKFEDVVRSNPPSPEHYFWDYIFRAFPDKSRADLVSYYFNVFMLQRRGYQNRHTPDNIDSDDNDEEAGPLRNVFGHQIQNSGHQVQSSRGSILLTPKKPHKKGK